MHIYQVRYESIDALRYTVEPITLHGEKFCAEAV